MASGNGFWLNGAISPVRLTDGQLERLVQVSEDVIDVLDAHA